MCKISLRFFYGDFLILIEFRLDLSLRRVQAIRKLEIRSFASKILSFLKLILSTHLILVIVPSKPWGGYLILNLEGG